VHQRDRGYLHSEIAANSVQGSNTVTGSHEGEGARGAFSFFRPRPDGRISCVKTASPAAQDDRSRMNVRPWFGSAVLACATHSFLGGGDKQPVQLLADEDRTTPAASPTRRWTEGPLLAQRRRSEKCPLMGAVAT